ncbi:hypothetical protein PAXRUDRAFT_151821 [Paxillus rubicundulus Ve08.2h10]|uniref:Zn(2)-C6 fungal-type domain-containing protein n=1 Tax=Paxillus rubicundulus Ve08.2h10 TaxID=930991 RepID=A0A0D0DWM2_9AGAM|nr:hypothetical protein PAXRUDRAFT_151821 [Paxillus rubicundulus Ve08.2h10]
MLVDASPDIPDFARAWHPSVRRPSKLPDPRSYHEVIDPHAIFELDEDGSTEPVLVVAFSCTFCKSVSQACSRSQPACTRCSKTGRNCRPSKEGYTRLPRPKVPRPSVTGTKKAPGTKKASSQAQQSGSSRLQVALSSDVNGGREAGSFKRTSLKRAQSPEAVVAPRKKPQVKPAAPKGKAIRKFVEPSKVSEIEAIEHAVLESPPQPHPTTTVSEDRRNDTKWSFIKGSSGRDENATVTVQDKLAPTVQSSTPIPRAWTNSRAELLTVFPDLAKAPTGLSWFQSLTPILVLETNHPEDHWTCSTTLNINLLWDFSCSSLDLEKCGIASQNPSHSEQDSQQSEVHPKDCPSPSGPTTNDVFPEAQTMAIDDSAQSSAPLISGQKLRDSENNEYVCGSATSSASPFVPLQREGATVMLSTPSASGELLADKAPTPTGSAISPPPPQVDLPRNIPLTKPPEIQTLLDSRAHRTPLLIWSSGDCKLTPCTLPQEYAYSCLGFFFISDLHREVINHTADFTPEAIQITGRVRWHVTLEWAPGGETALFAGGADRLSSSDMVDGGLALPDSREDLSHPWWLSSVELEVSSQANTAAPYRPRDLRMHYFSYLPLDLLAEFHPSESFPRGWYCEKCRMINAQEFFRHQICQSSVCKSMSDERICQGKTDPLWKLRDPHHSHFLTYPTVNVPSFLQYNERFWDDGMQSWTYLVKKGVSLRHIFTGNQENLQKEATALLETIQCDILLKKEDSSSPYFMHTTTLIPDSNDTPGATVPVGTSAAISSVYHALIKLAEGYGEIASPQLSELHIRAWVTTGSKRASGYVLHAKKCPVVILCLGAQVILNFIPKTGYSDALDTTTTDKVTCGDDRTASPLMERRAESPLDMTVAHDSGFKVDQRPTNSQSEKDVMGVVIVADHEYTGFDPDSSTMDPGSGLNMPSQPELDDIVLEHKNATEPMQRPARQKTKAIKEKRKPTKKTPYPEISLTLVHGDGVILIGDDFECQIIRTGTTIRQSNVLFLLSS